MKLRRRTDAYATLVNELDNIQYRVLGSDGEWITSVTLWELYLAIKYGGGWIERFANPLPSAFSIVIEFRRMDKL
jgi:hypothetical protein